MFRCAILDDYQDCALTFADWTSLDGVEAKNFTDPAINPDELAQQLAGFEIIVAMRERTRFDAALLARLPRLKLLVNWLGGQAKAAIRGHLETGDRRSLRH